MIKEIKTFIEERAEAAKVASLVIGISGGLDSALVLALCAELPFRIIPVSIPCDSSDLTRECTQELCDKFKVTPYVSDIQGAVAEIKDIVPILANNNIVLGNIKARLRMTTLYAYANVFNGMVVGTTNLTEMLLGYFTKFGDGACDIEPIAHLAKFEVKEMATVLGVPKIILDRTPSADLWDDQTDEKELGFSYDQLDGAALRLVMPTSLPIGTPASDPRARGFLEGRYESSMHKRILPPSIRRPGQCLVIPMDT